MQKNKINSYELIFFKGEIYELHSSRNNTNI